MATDNGTLEMRAGDYKTLTFTITDADNSGAALDLTTLTVTWAAASDLRGTPEITKTESGGITITDAAGGLCTVDIDSTDTASLTPGLYDWQIELTDTNAQSNVVGFGKLKIKPNAAD